MIYPMMLKIDFGSIVSVGESRRVCSSPSS